jgi:uncharacterized protein YidB (DUF937 family)
MGMFDQLLGGVVGEFGSGSQRESLMDLAAGVVRDHPGGLGGLLGQFKSAGLGSQADSWVSTGQNMPVSSDQVSSVLGAGNIEAMARKLGINPQVASAGLAALLPIVIDHLTPRGQVEGGTDFGAALSSLKSQIMV